MNCAEEWVLQNKDKIEKGVEIIGQTCEILAATVGQLHPILKAVLEGSAMLLNDPEGREAKYLAKKFQEVNSKLAAIQNEIDSVARERKRAVMNMYNFEHEVKMIGQYEKFLEFVDAEPKYKNQTKDTFLSYFESTKGDLSLEAFYHAVTGENSFGVPMLQTLVTIEQKRRRAVEKFCVELKGLFIMGIIAVVGHTALKERSDRKDLVEKWQDRLEEVEKRMKAAVDDCTENFASQAKEDIRCRLKEEQGSADQTFTKPLLKFLKEKYDWVFWSLLVINHNEWCLWNWMAGEKYHGHCGGGNLFSLPEEKKEVVVFYSADPKPINKSQVLKQIKTQKQRRNMEDVAHTLHKHLPNCVIHAISQYKDVKEANNFPEGCYYFDKHGSAYLCIYSE